MTKRLHLPSPRLRRAHARFAAAAVAALLLSPAATSAQQARVSDLVVADGSVPVRLVGYGLVVGLDGSGDRALGSTGSRQTVQSVVNLLRNFDIDVPAEMLRTRNVAAVLVTAELSPYLRPGGRFDVHVSSMGDASSLSGGVLWATPLVAGPGGPAFATAQGPVSVSSANLVRTRSANENSGRIAAGGILAVDLPRGDFAASSRLMLREPNLDTALRIANAVNAAAGADIARADDPGAITLQLPANPAGPAAAMAAVMATVVDAPTTPRILIDSRDGTVVAGGDIAIGDAVVSHGTVTLTIGDAGGEGMPGGVRIERGASVQDVAAALHGIGATAPIIAAMFEGLVAAGALRAELVLR